LDDALTDILEFLGGHFGEDFQSYSKAVAGKRIAERMGQLRLAEPSAYRQALAADPAEPARLARMLRIRFSSFFRDPLQFELLAQVVVPAMLNDCRKGLFRVWSAACAGGEEAYSLAIVIDEAGELLRQKPAIQIFATDIAEDALEEARQACYQPLSVAGSTLKRLERYFTAEKSGYRVAERIRTMVTCSRHDLLDPKTYAPPESLFGGFDLVSCRNFLMYLDPQAYLRVFDKLFRALNPEGVLLLGRAETVPERYQPYLEKVVDFGNMYRKKACSGG
jgi:chemotaxis protein methyltransferase CheR